MAKFTDENIDENYYIKVKEPHGCAMCHSPTHYLDCLIEDYFCSDECTKAFYKLADDSTPND